METKEKAKYELIQDVTKGDLLSAYVEAPFDDGLEVLQKDVYLNENQVEECLTDCVELTSKFVPTNGFGEDEITKYAFGEHAENYGKFLKGYGIEEMPIWLADIQDKPFACKVWFTRLGRGDSRVWFALRR